MLANRTSEFEDGVNAAEVWFHRKATAYVEAQILFHLNQVGVFAKLVTSGPISGAEIAAQLHLDEDVTEALLDYVYEVDELLDRDDKDRYSLSHFGRQVVQRFSNPHAAEKGAINLFDVRVGGYAPVWANLGHMLRSTGRYGQDFRRDGRFAEGGVSKLSNHFWPALRQTLSDCPVKQVLEIGLTGGLLERIGKEGLPLSLYGLDRSAESIARASARAAAIGASGIEWIQQDLFAPDAYCDRFEKGVPLLIFSLHFHEFLAAGEEKFVAWLSSMRQRVSQLYLLALEQPLLPRAMRSTLREQEWLYAQSNVLIHHLIGNGRILSQKAWIDLGTRAGCKLLSDRLCGYLGYRAFVFEA